MPFNGSGGTTQPAGSIYPATANTLIESAKSNVSFADIYTMLGSCIVKDGQTTTTQRIPFAAGASMGSQTITAVADGTAVTHAATVGQVRSGAPVLLGSVAGTNTITAALTPALTAYAAGNKFILTPANTNTGATTVNIDSVGAKNIFWNGVACVGGELRQNIPALIEYDGTQFHIVGNGFNAPFLDTHAVVEGSADSTKKLRFEVDGLTTGTTRVATWQDSSGTVAYLSNIVQRSYLAGCTLSTAGSSATMSIAAGQCTDSTNTESMTVAAIAKTTSAWAVGTGNGGLDTGAIANSTWYAFYAIKRTDTGVVDVVFSTSGSSPTLPANYTLYRRIGWGLTDGSAQWVAFTQYGDEFWWTVPVNDVNAQATATANRTARALTAAPSTTVIADIYYRTNGTGVNEFCFLSSADMTDNAASATNFSLAVSAATNPEYGSGEFRYRLNSSRQMYDRGSAAGTMGYMTKGWIDTRGRDD